MENIRTYLEEKLPILCGTIENPEKEAKECMDKQTNLIDNIMSLIEQEIQKRLENEISKH
jgi:hypothetical protein